MLLTTALSRAKKTDGVAITYRAGAGACFATCPTSCALNPSTDGTTHVDREYLDALLESVPVDGVAFTYSHFHWRQWWPRMIKRIASGLPTTVINFSADTTRKIDRAMARGIPTVYAMPEPEETAPKVSYTDGGTRVIRCPATYLPISCAGCGGGSPLCARVDRDYAIGFPAHGASKRKVGTDTAGGCYAAGGHVALHWRGLSKRAQPESDASKLRSFVRSLLPRTILRHHVAGDIGLEQ